MSYAIEQNIQAYAHDLIADHIRTEYDLQIGKWERHLLQVAGDCKTAFNAFTATLEKVRQEQQAAWDFLMLAFSLVSGPALSWISGTIQYKVYPALAAKTGQVSERVKLISSGQVRSVTYNATLVRSQADYDKVAAKVFGDLGQTGAGLAGSAWIGKPAWPYSTIEGVTAATDADTFERRLKTAMSEQRDAVTKRIMDLALGIRDSKTFGRDWLTVSYGEDPKKMKDPPEVQEDRARRLVKDWLNSLRQQWAKSWYYFGNDPVPHDSIAFQYAIEREVWAMWVLEQEFKYKVRVTGLFAGEPKHHPGTNKPLHPTVLDRMADVDIVPARSAKQALRYRDRVVAAGRPIEVGASAVSGAVDSEKEVKALNSWALGHTPHVLAGNLDGQPRALPAIENIYK